MRLIKAKVENYKCVEDSTLFNIDQITCLVGKNESGKTSLLESLYKLNPVESDKADFNEEEFPRRHLSTYRERQELDPSNVLTTIWEMDNAEVEEINKLISPAKLFESEVKITKGYDNKLNFKVLIDQTDLVESIISEANLNAPENSQLSSADSIDSLIVTIQNLEKPTEKQNSILNKLKEKYPSGNLISKVVEILMEKLPHFVYFSNYYQLPGKVSIDDVKRRKKENNLEFKHKVFLSLLEMTNTSIENIEGIGELEKLIMELEAVEASLTDEIKRYWSQNKHLEVRFRYDHSKSNDPPPFNKGFIFNTRIYNTRHRATVSFGERSHGFIWFFSFLVWFSQVKRQYGDDLILLLDEPGLPLHGRAQQDLIEYMNERLRPHHQVLYTAHSPFLIDVENIYSLRTVEDVVKKIEKDGRDEEKILGTKVGQRILSRDKDTIFPLQGILGFDIAQTLFVGPNVIVVEGPTEKSFFDWFSRELSKRDREGLDIRWVVCPAEGASKISSFVTLFAGRGLNIAVFADYHNGQKRMIDNLSESGLIKENHVLRTSDFIGRDSDIEDVVGRTLYVDLVNKALGLSSVHALQDKKLPDASSRIVKEVEEYCRTLPGGYPEFNHYKPVKYLLSLSDQKISKLPDLDEALERFEEIFKTINKLVSNDQEPS